ncbi:MAG: OmpH family outer membrane protein [Pseudomonadota bacterium]
MGALGRFAVLWLMLLAAPVAAQNDTRPVQSLILVVDQERLLAESQLGAAVLGEIEAEARSLAAENRAIEAELLAEEQALTEQRDTLAPSEFTDAANAFDEKVRRLRSEQDTKSRALNRAGDEARQAFFGDIGGILSDIARERGAVVMLERRQAFLSVDTIDITDEAIERINLTLAPEDDAE